MERFVLSGYRKCSEVLGEQLVLRFRKMGDLLELSAILRKQADKISREVVKNNCQGSGQLWQH